jgi:hypothetical protein
MVFKNHTINVIDTRLSHNCGANFDPTIGDATVPIYSFSKYSQACFKIASPESNESWDFASLVKEVAVSQENTIKSGMSTVPIGGTKSFDFTQNALEKKAIVFDWQKSKDLFLAIHKASLNISKLVYVYKKESSTKVIATQVIIEATIEDLYDFKYYSNDLGGLLGVKEAAAFQIGQGRSVDSYGKIFVTRFNIDATFTKLTRTDIDVSSSGYIYNIEKPSGYSHTITW